MPKPPPISSRLKAREEAIHQQVLAALHAPPPKHVTPGIPAKFRRAEGRVNRIVTATPDHPRLAIEGDSVWLAVASGRTLAATYGPYIPANVQGTSVRQTSTSFIVKLTRTRGSIPLAGRDFSIIDELGDRIVPRIEVVGGGKLPAHVAPGHPVSLRMLAELPIGNGQLQYNPTGIHGGKVRPLVAWDFDVETD